MRKEAWLAATNPTSMVRLLTELGYPLNHRRFHFFALACSRVASPAMFGERTQKSVELAERYLVGMATEDEYNQAKEVARVAREETLEFHHTGDESETRDASGYPVAYAAAMAAWVGWRAVVGEYHLDMVAKVRDSLVMRGFLRAEYLNACLKVLANALRDIFGNPFRPVAVESEWLTSTVTQLARGIYEERAFDRMPILADALQDAGCDNSDILTHCRDESITHVRGCWVVDLLLGKS